VTQYAHYDHNAREPIWVDGWYDTEVIKYTNLPPMEDMLVINNDQWIKHFDNPSAWAVKGGKLVPYVPVFPGV
jgi:hypothetical protein